MTGNRDQIDAWAAEFVTGKVLLFNKPLYWTSFDLVNKIKAILKHNMKLPKIRVGHAGTLDPLATGLIIVCTGKETKNIEKYQAQPKEYIANITLGAVTPSFDLETGVSEIFPTHHIDLQLIEHTLNSFKGTQMQMPPDYSARFVGGTRAYKLARKGEPVELKPREIIIYDIELLTVAMPRIEIRIVCSKGTYVRSLARDIGEKMDSGAHLSALVRTAIGDFTLEHALSIEEFQRNFIFL
jgi:tRNA pseudouridine55 synthase